MRGFSRTMPPAPSPPWTVGGTLALVAIVGGLLAYCYFHPLFALILGGLVLVAVVATIVHDRRLRKLASTRADDSICTFARAFDRRRTDPWIIRAVWEELQIYLPSKHDDFPIHPSDRLYECYGIDAEELYDIAGRVAVRTGRSLDLTSTPPEQVATAGDFVRVMNAQRPNPV